LNLIDEHNHQGRAQILGQLGRVAYERFQEARAGAQADIVVLRHLNTAAQFHHKALGLLPTYALFDLAVQHNALGEIYRQGHQLDQGLHHFREAIRYFEVSQAHWNAATARYNVAITLTRARRYADALAYADAALRGFQTFGDRAADMIQQTQELIEEIREDIQGGGG